MADTEDIAEIRDSAGGSTEKTVFYKGRFLYSKYNPARAILQTVQSLSIQEGTLVIIHSPCLFYGLKELLQKLPRDCKILAIEAENPLLSIGKEALNSLECKLEHLIFFDSFSLEKIDSTLRKIAASGAVRRVLPVDFSAGATLNKALYNRIDGAATEIIAMFWKNRITLVRMGRLFSKNLFLNLRTSKNDRTLSDYAGTVKKPLLVCGAGESLDETFSIKNSAFLKKAASGFFYIIATDVILCALLERGIKVDAVVGVESQPVIQKAYIGAGGFCGTAFLDTCSRAQVAKSIKNFGGTVAWFFSQYTEASFLDALKEKSIIKDVIPPLGSVGLTSLYIALLLRASTDVPIFVTGMDFSYSPGRTHALSTPHQKNVLFRASRFTSVYNFASAYSDSAIKEQGKNGHKVITTTVLSLYASSFAARFSGKANVFDIGNTGKNIGLRHILPKNIEEYTTSTFEESLEPPVAATKGELYADAEKTDAFYRTEKEALLRLKDLLTNGEKAARFEHTKPLATQIRELLLGREYLYLHFPDGYRLSMEEHFLKRVRAEIDFFLKQIELGKL